MGKTRIESEASPVTPGRAPEKPQLARLGRFTILSRLGEGAMGIVFAAYDEQLDRKVAVKMLRNETLLKDSKARDRMLREAKTMARVSHPNIVTIHDVGTHEGEIWIAMEIVSGMNLIQWLAASPRAWREILGVFLQAGRGLAAAHAAGVIHRDFKPANVLVSREGVVKVVDFGLARSVHARRITDSLDLSQRDLGVGFDVGLTHPGTMLGTPAYMSPEQHVGAPATDRSDQFAFCVALWEALYGEPPFDRTSLDALKHAVTQGRLREPMSGRVPARFLPILRRGLALDPSRRFSGMTELLVQLERVVGARRSPWWMVAGLTGLLVGGNLALALRMERGDPCSSAAGERVGLWDTSAAAAARIGILATRAPFAEETWARVQPRLDVYADALVEMRGDACRAHEEGRASERMFDLRTACLDQRHASFATFVGILQNADTEVVGKAAAAAAALPPVATCGHLPTLTDAVALPGDPALAERVGELRGLLAEVEAYELTGQFSRGLALLDQVDIQTLEHPPVLAELGLRRGSLLSETGRHSEAVAVLNDALRQALASGHDTAAAMIATRRDFVRVAHLQLAQDVLSDAPIVEGLVARVEAANPSSGLRGDHLNNLGIARALVGQEHLAVREFEASITARTTAFGANHPLVVYALGNLGRVMLSGDDLVGATHQLEAAFLAAESALGPKHPHVAVTVLNLGVGYRMLGRRREALARLSHALSLQTELLGSDAPDLHYVLSELGELALVERRCDEAGESFQRALTLIGAEDHASQLQARFGLGQVAACRGDFAAARELMERALASAEKTRGETPVELLDGLGDMLVKAGNLDHAMDYYKRGEALRRARLPPNSSGMNESYWRIAEVLRRQRRYGEAAEVLQDAQDLLAGERQTTSLIAAQLAASLGALALDRGEAEVACDHYRKAAAIYGALGDPDTLELALVRFGQARALVAQAERLTPEAQAFADKALVTLMARGSAFALEGHEIRTWLDALAAR